MEIKNIKKVHTIEHRLKDSKVSVNRDFKFNVSEVEVEGKQGHTKNMPHWVGNILADNNLAVMDSPDMITELKQALSKEKLVGEYQMATLEPHFYIKLKESMHDLEHYDFNKIESMMFELFRMRRGKIIKIGDSIKLSTKFYNKLTVEELVFYKTIRENSLEFEKQVIGDMNEHRTN